MPPSTQNKSTSQKNSVQPRNSLAISILIYLWMGLWTALVFLLEALPFLVGLCLPPKPRSAIMRRLALFWGMVAIHLAAWPWIRIHRIGAAVVPGPAIHVFNHRSAFDAFLAATLAKDLVQGVNGWPMRLPLLGFAARQAGYLDITCMTHEEIQTRAEECLSQGISMVFFPEGHRSGDAPLQPFRSGAFRLARELGVPLQPIVITGNERIPDLHFRMAPGRIRIDVLPAISPEEQANFTNAFTLKQHVRKLMLEHNA